MAGYHVRAVIQTGIPGLNTAMHTLKSAKKKKNKKKQKQMSIEAYDLGREDGIAEERKRILDWVKDNRRVLEIDDEVFFYRDSFNSEDLIRFIEQKEINEPE